MAAFDEPVRIDDSLLIPREELTFTTARSSGPGGQHVNKVETRVTLRFDVAASPSLDEEQRRRIREALATRINKAGVLLVSAQAHRSQLANRELAVERFAALLRDALAETPERRPTRPSRTARRRRLEIKRRRGRLKRERSGPDGWEG